MNVDNETIKQVAKSLVNVFLLREKYEHTLSVARRNQIRDEIINKLDLEVDSKIPPKNFTDPEFVDTINSVLDIFNLKISYNHDHSAAYLHRPGNSHKVIWLQKS